MADKFDAYREGLVLETNTIWPSEYDDVPVAEKYRIATALHANPEPCSQLEYVRMHTGFCRQITVTSDDVDRVAKA